MEIWLRGLIISMSFRLPCSANIGEVNSSNFITILKDAGYIKQLIACFLHPTRNKIVPSILFLEYSVLQNGFIGSLKGCCDTKEGSMRKKREDLKGRGEEGKHTLDMSA